MCPTCSPRSSSEAYSGNPKEERKNFSDRAWSLITQGSLQPHENYSDEELHAKLVSEIDWRIRDMWREDYLAMIREGLRVHALATTAFGDPRLLTQHALSDSCNLPMYTIQRALRFVFAVRRNRWDSESFSAPDRIDSIFHFAKTAAAFLDVAHAVMRVDIDAELRTSDLLRALLQAPSEPGTCSFPLESIRITKEMEASAQVVAEKGANRSNGPRSPETGSSVSLAAPLCGWTGLSNIPQGNIEWKDPRECCLCHLCGDDDAGLPSGQDMEIGPPESETTTHLGRLLPMAEGCFVHTSCALWSSEAWEDANEGLINAVEKAKGRGSQLKCFGCGFYGATVGCCKCKHPFLSTTCHICLCSLNVLSP